MWHALGLGILLLVIFLVDTFLLVPKDVKLFTKEHLLDGDKTGLLTVKLKLVTSKVKKGELWRPATSMFLHAGLVHILFNLACLWLVGSVLEPIFSGHVLVLFFLSGVFSALCMMLFTSIEDGLGASTGIFGLLGVGLVWAFKDFAYILQAMTHWHWFVLLIMVTLGNSTDKLTRLEHLTGTVGGVLLGIIFSLIL